jgi:hypothetical protein
MGAKYSYGVWERFAHQASSILRAVLEAEEPCLRQKHHTDIGADEGRQSPG